MVTIIYLKIKASPNKNKSILYEGPLSVWNFDGLGAGFPDRPVPIIQFCVEPEPLNKYEIMNLKKTGDFNFLRNKTGTGYLT